MVCQLREQLKMVFDEFEFDTTSIRRTVSGAMQYDTHCMCSHSNIHRGVVC